MQPTDTDDEMTALLLAPDVYHVMFFSSIHI